MKLILIFLLLLLQIAQAQTIKQCGFNTVIHDRLNNPVTNATVELLRSQDSVLVKTALTDDRGNLQFEKLEAGSYILKLVLLNYKPTFSPVFTIDETTGSVQLPAMELEKISSQLEAITVTAKKPFIQKLNDRIVVNVENSMVNAGSSAMEVLDRSPGINIDQNDVLSLRGRSGVIVMIDGKPTAMTGTDLANYLRSLPAAAIERIDIITNPSSKYDAAGNSGIIDIRMKKDQRLGTNGTVTAGYGQGVYPKANTGTTFNYRNKKLNIFGNYNYAYRKNLNHLLLDRNFFNDGVYNGGDLKDNYTTSPVSSNTARVGMDYFISDKTILGLVLNGNFNQIRRNTANESIVLDPVKVPVSTFQSGNSNRDGGNNRLANLNFKHNFDSSGRELSADADYGVYHSKSFSLNTTKYFRLDNTKLQPDYMLEGNQDGKLILRTFKADYVNPLEKNSKFEAGIKASYVSSDNDAQFADLSSGVPVNDAAKTNHFRYHEYNNAAYLNYAKQWKKFDAQLGLRAEHTSISTEQEIGKIRYDSSYLQLFPTAFLNYKLKEDQSIGLSVSRRIGRPGYSQLNPFLFLIDVTTYSTGRPGLLPEFTWAYDFNYTFKNFHFTLGYSRSTNTQNIAIAKFRDVFPQLPSAENVTLQIPINLASSQNIGLSVSAPVRVNGWWNMVNNANIYYNHFDGSVGSTVLNAGRPSVELRTNNVFTFKNGWAGEMNANYSGKGQYGFMVTRATWGLAAGVQKAVLKQKGTLRLSITDIFWTNVPGGLITYNNYVEKWTAYRETRVANLIFTWRFGSNKVQAARKRTTGSEEERQRAGN